MDEIFESLKIAKEQLFRFLGVKEALPEFWLWAGLGCLLLLALLGVVRFTARKRREKGKLPGVPGKGEAEKRALTSEEAVSSKLLEVGRGEPVRSSRMQPGGSEVEAGPEPRLTEAARAGEPAETLLERLRGRLAKTHDQLIGRLDQILLSNRTGDEDLLQELEEVLVTADLGVKTSCELLREVQKEINKKPAYPLELKAALRQKIRLMLDVEGPAFSPDRAKPFVIVVVGVNGVGKTTSIGKLAAHLKGKDRKVMLVAADTFRAAAIEQLQIWADRVGTDFVKHRPESDPSAVVYDAIQASKSRNTDLVIVDTAGRLHTKTNLMEELKKVKRVIGRELEGAPHEILLVVDATTGQNAITQARTFHEALGVTGIILTKLDGTAKGGVIVGIAHELELPVRFIGIGEGLEDLRAFDRDLFLEAVFAEPENDLVH